ncbi:MAG TPA: energy-coupled thiamine transporter ThiT, partial [Candidatus Fimiplasma intestinipullorum]|nr:energy-coupled thiamine transporter ThiT [Candidatus Fimiplasma intestinipullorum]
MSILQFVLGIALYYGPWSVLLDYVLPLAVCGLASLIKIVRVRNV